MEITKNQIEKAINKGWVFYGEFSTDVAVKAVMELLYGGEETEEIEYCPKWKWGDCECEGDCRRGLTKG